LFFICAERTYIASRAAEPDPEPGAPEPVIFGGAGAGAVCEC